MTKLYASSSGAASSRDVSCVPAQEEVVIEQYDRLLRDIRSQLDEFPVGETVLVGNCPPDISEEEVRNFFHGFATAVCLEKVSAKTLTTTLYIAKFDSAESASRSKVLHTLSLKEKKILLLQLDDRQLFGKNHVVELNGFQDHPEEVIYDHMSAFGQVNFILKTKSVAYVVYEEPSSVDSSSRCEYLDQYPVTIRSVLDTSSGSVASASASGIESCILDQLDQHDSLLVEEDEGQINNFMQLLDMDNLDEYMEMNEREKSVVIDKPLLDVGNEEIIANDDCVEEEDSANGADVAAIEKQAFQRKQSVEEGYVLVDDQSAQWLKLDGNLLRLIDLPQLRVRVQKAAPIRKTKDNWTPSKKPKHKESGDSKSDRKRSDEEAKKPKKDKPRKEHSDGTKKEKSEKPKSGDDGPKLGKHRETSPAKKSSKDNAKKEERAQTSDVAVNVEVEPEKLKSSKESPPKKSSKEQPKKERTKSSQSVDVVVKTEPAQPDGETPSKAAKQPTTPQKDETVAFKKQPLLGQRKPVVILRRLTAKQLEELSIVRRASASVVPTSEATRVEQDRKHDKSSEEKRRREKEKRKRSKQSGDSGDAKRRKNDNGSKESEKKPEPVVADVKKAEPVVIQVEITSMNVETPVVDEENAAKEIVRKPDLSCTLLSDDEEQRLVIDLPAEAKPEVEKPPEPVVQPEPIKPPPKQNRVVVKLDTQSAAILHDKVHDSYLLHLDVLSRVLIKLNKISIAGYRLPKPPAKVDRPKKTTEQSSRKSPVEEAAKKREEKLHAEKPRKTDLEKIDNKFLPVGSKLKSQAKAKSKHESSHKKQHHHVPVPELPAELKKSHLNTSFKIPKKSSHSSKQPAAHSTAKHSRSELDCLHQEDAERERQRKRFQKEPKRPEDRHRSKKPAAAPVGEQQRSNTPDFFDPTWDDDGGGGGDASPLPEPEIQTKKPFVPGGNEKDKKTPSFRDIWNLPPEKPKVWEKDPWANNTGTIDSGEMWGAAERAQQAVPVLPLFAQEPTGNQRSNTIDAGDRWSLEPGRQSPNVRKFSDSTVKQGNTIDAGECWSPGGAPPHRPNSSTERRRPKPSDKATIGDGESWSPEADTSKKITALNLDQRRRSPSRQEEMPRKQPPPRRQESSAPRGGIDTIASGDLWDTEPAGVGGKPMLCGPIWESEAKLERSKENVVPDFLHDEDQYRKRSRSPPPVRHRQQYPRETSRERSREESWGRSGRSGGRDARNVFGSPPREHWAGPKEEERHRSASTDRSEPARRQDDDEIPYSPSNFLDGDENSSINLLLETIPLQLPLKTSPRKQLGVTQRPQSATEEPPTGEESVVQPSFRIKQEQLLTSQESTTMEEEPAASPTAEAPVNVKLENRSTEPVQTAVVEQQRPSSSANVVDPEAQEEIAPERLSALGHLKQRAERLKKLEEMKLARQKLMAQIKLQKETEKIPQVEEEPQQPVQPEPQQPVQPEPQVPKMPKLEPPSEEVAPPSVTDIKQEPHQVDPSAASLLLETAVSILSSFGHLLPSMAAGPSSAAAAPLPPLPTTPSLPPPLPAETPKPPLPDEPPPLPPATAIVPLPVWEPPGFAPMPNLGVPPPFNMQPPPAVAFEEVEQQPFQDFSMGQGDINGGFQENSFHDWQSQGPTFNSGGGYDDQPQNFDNFDDEQSWERRQPQDVQPFNDGPDSWQQQPNYFNNPQNQQQGESLMLLPPEEIHVQRRGPPRQFDGGFGGNQGNRDPRQRFRGNNRGHNNNAFRDPRRNRGGSIYAGGGGGGFQQQQQQQGQQRNRNNNKNFNRGGGQFGNQNRNRNNSWKQGNQRRGGGFKNFFPQQQQQQQQQQGDEFLIDGAGGDVSNWDDFMQ
ncbi:hypothetical protein quinque_013782 [Culex quinquefasciatus]